MADRMKTTIHKDGTLSLKNLDFGLVEALTHALDAAEPETFAQKRTAILDLQYALAKYRHNVRPVDLAALEDGARLIDGAGKLYTVVDVRRGKETARVKRDGDDAEVTCSFATITQTCRQLVDL